MDKSKVNRRNTGNFFSSFFAVKSSSLPKVSEDERPTRTVSYPPPSSQQLTPALDLNSSHTETVELQKDSLSPTLAEVISSELLDSAFWSSSISLELGSNEVPKSQPTLAPAPTPTPAPEPEQHDGLQIRPTILPDVSVKKFSLPPSQLKPRRRPSTSTLPLNSDSLSSSQQSPSYPMINGDIPIQKPHFGQRLSSLSEADSSTSNAHVRLAKQWANKASNFSSATESIHQRDSKVQQEPKLTTRRSQHTLRIERPVSVVSSSSDTDDEDSVHGSSSEDEKPLVGIARSSPMPQKLGRVLSQSKMQTSPVSSPTSPRLSGLPAPSHRGVVGSSRHSISETSSDSQATLTATSPPPPVPKTLKSFMAAIFTSAGTSANSYANSSTADVDGSDDVPRVHRSSSSLGMRSTSPAPQVLGRSSSSMALHNTPNHVNHSWNSSRRQLDQPPPGPPPPVTVVNTVINRSSSGLLVNLPPPGTPPPSSIMARTLSEYGGRTTWMGNEFGPSMHGGEYNDALPFWTSGSEYGGKSIWNGSDTQSESSRRSGGSQTQQQPLVFIEGVTYVSSGHRIGTPQPPPGLPPITPPFLAFPPPAAPSTFIGGATYPTPPANPEQLLEHIRYHQEMATKAYEEYYRQQQQKNDGRPLSLASNSSNKSNSSVSSPLAASGKAKNRASKATTTSVTTSSSTPTAIIKNKQAVKVASEKSRSSKTAPRMETPSSSSSGTESLDENESSSESNYAERTATATASSLVVKKRLGSASSLASSTTNKIMPPSILRSSSSNSAFDSAATAGTDAIVRVKKGVKFDPDATTEDGPGPMTKRKKKSGKKAVVVVGEGVVV